MGFFPNIKVEQLGKIFLAYVSIFSSRVVDNMPIYNDKNPLAKTEIGPPTYILFGGKGSRKLYKFSKNSLPSYERIRVDKKLRLQLAYRSFACKSCWILITSLDF